jgi:hypothetical protein
MNDNRKNSTLPTNPQAGTTLENPRTSSVILTEALFHLATLTDLLEEGARRSRSPYHSQRLRRLSVGLAVVRDPIVLAAGSRSDEVRP